MKTFKLILRSLINNEAAIEGGRKKPWYFAIIMAVLSIIISLIPALVQGLNKNGMDFINSQYTYGYEVGLRAFLEDIYTANDLELKISDSESGHILNIPQETWNAHFVEQNTQGLNRFAHVNSDNVVDFEVYYFDHDLTNEDRDKIETIKIDEETTAKTTASYIAFGKYSFMTKLYSLTSSTAKATYYGDYVNFAVGYNFKTLAEVTLASGAKVNPTNVDKAQPSVYKQYQDGIFENYKGYLNVGFQNNKINDLVRTLLILLAINVGLLLFMGLMMFVLTRGKTNPFRIYTFWETQKIAYWCAPAPAVIGMIIGFIMASFSQVSFPMVLGLRVMWLSMRALRPENATETTTSPTVKTVDVKSADKKAKK